MISITSTEGRIGPLWWRNSDLTPRKTFVPVTIGIVDTGMVLPGLFIQWGTFGFDVRHQRIAMAFIEGSEE